MTVHQPALFLPTVSNAAEDWRGLVSALMGGRSGVVGDVSMKVTQSATPAMTVVAAGGMAFAAGSLSTYQGTYHVQNRGNLTLTVTAADSTNPRKDLVVARVRDAVALGSGSLNDWDIVVVAGTAAASPVSPAAPANSVVLARIDIAPNATSITNANITDLRFTTAGQMRPPGGVQVDPDGTFLSTGDFTGQVRVRLDTGEFSRWDGTAWQRLAGGTVAKVTPTWATGWGQAIGDNAVVLWKDSGGIVHLAGVAYNQNTFTPAGELVMTLPVGYRPAALTFGVVPYSVGGGVGHWDIHPDGSVNIIRSTGSVTALSLHGLHLFWPAA